MPPAIASPSRAGLRRLPVPDPQPPYDDEAWAATGPRPVGDAVQGTLALAFVLPSGVPASPAPPPGLRLVPDLPPASGDDGFGPVRTARNALPEPRGWAARLVQAIVEVRAGDRPLAQLVRWTTAEVYDTLAASMPQAPGSTRAGAARAVVRSVHVSEPGDGVAEVAAMIRSGSRTTAVALRLEGLDGRWQCTALQLG